MLVKQCVLLTVVVNVNCNVAATLSLKFRELSAAIYSERPLRAVRQY
jgi:hypothetical protein